MVSSVRCVALLVVALVFASNANVQPVLAAPPLEPTEMKFLNDFFEHAVWTLPLVNSHWNNSANPCDEDPKISWVGVVCFVPTCSVPPCPPPVSRILRFNMQSYVSSCVLPASVSALTYNTEITLNSCGLRGTIPESIGNCRALKVLDLGHQVFSGAVASAGLTGSIPSVIGLLPDLHVLSLTNNFLTGSVPATFSQLSKLTSLSLSFNDLGGEFPTLWLANTTLTVLDLRNNLGFTGNLEFLTVCTQMQFLFLAGSKFGGPMDFLNGAATNWVTIMVAGNKFTSMPGTMARHVNLLNMDVSNNNIAGALPDLPNPKLLIANFAGNQFTGSIPASYFANTSVLEQIDLSDNQLTGLPPFVAGVSTQITCLSLSNNPFVTTSIPPEIVNMTSLQILSWHDAGLIGPIPDLPLSLHSLDLSDNALTGPFPQSILSMTKLGISGVVCNNPDSDPTIKQAHVLQLHDNGLSGPLPLPQFSSRDAVGDAFPALDLTAIDLSQNYWSDPPAWCNIPSGLCGTRVVAADPSSNPVFFSKWPILFQGLFLGGGAVFVIGLITLCVCLRRRHQQKRATAHAMGYVSAPAGPAMKDDAADDADLMKADVSAGDPLSSPVMIPTSPDVSNSGSDSGHNSPILGTVSHSARKINSLTAAT